MDQDAAVEHATREDRDTAALALRQQRHGGTGVEQRVTAGDEHAVQVGAGQEPLQHLDLVHADAHGPDDTLRAKIGEGRVRLVERLPPVLVRVMDQHDVNTVDAQPAHAGLQGGEHTVPRVVAHPPQPRRAVETLGAVDVVGGRFEQPADLGRQDVVAARPPGEEPADAALGLPTP